MRSTIRWAFIVHVAAAASALAATGDTLTLRDLPNHPERWPATVTIAKAMAFDGGKIAAGAALPMMELQGNDVVVDAGGKLGVIAVAPADCDLVAAANAMWAKLTPAQRAIDAKSLETDASLWPEKVVSKIGFTVDGGAELPAMAEYACGGVRDGNVTLVGKTPAGVPARLQASVAQTDIFQRARDRVAIDADKRTSALIEAIKPNCVDVDGKPATIDAIDQTKLFALYYGASWCAPCRKFSPTFVAYANEAMKANPHLTVVMLNFDDEPAKMLDYLRSEKMPFLAVPKATVLGQAPLIANYRGTIPELIVADKYGKVMATTTIGTKWMGPDDTLRRLKAILATGVAK